MIRQSMLGSSPQGSPQGVPDHCIDHTSAIIDVYQTHTGSCPVLAQHISLALALYSVCQHPPHVTKDMLQHCCPAAHL